MGKTFNNLCDSCTNNGCVFQSGIVRTKCAFYMPPHIEPDNCGNYVVQDPTTENCESCRYYGSHHEVCNYCYECSLWTDGEITTKNDLALIHTEGLDEEIRCTMCTNSMKSDRGCDGSCVVNKDMYKAVMDAIGKRIQPAAKNDLGVDREQLEDFARWVAIEIINEEMWEYNHQSFTELACRKLVKLGIMQESNGEYLYKVAEDGNDD